MTAVIHATVTESIYMLNLAIASAFRGWAAMRVVTDTEIQQYVKEKKSLPKDFKPALREGKISQRYNAEIKGEHGNTFRILIRRSKRFPDDFSVIFGVVLGKSLFRLRRYNGKGHNHFNKVEGNHLTGMHIHHATQRYQERGFAEETYAVAAGTRYSTWEEALKAMMADNNFHRTSDSRQLKIDFEEDGT